MKLNYKEILNKAKSGDKNTLLILGAGAIFMALLLKYIIWFILLVGGIVCICFGFYKLYQEKKK